MIQHLMDEPVRAAKGGEQTAGLGRSVADSRAAGLRCAGEAEPPSGAVLAVTARPAWGCGSWRLDSRGS